MTMMYLPTIDHSLWPCAVLLVVFIPISVWHEVGWRRTLAEYAALRCERGVGDRHWPPSELRWVLSLQPWLILAATALLGAMVALGAAALLTWPHRLSFFNEVINYYDRPYLTVVLIAGAAAVIGGCALAVDLARSPWKGVAFHLRRAVHVRQPVRDARFSAALEVDPGVLAAVQARKSDSAAGDDVADADVLGEQAVGDLEDAVGPRGD